LTTGQTLLNFKVKGQGHDFFGVFCVHNTAVIRGPYLALSKAWLCCLLSGHFNKPHYGSCPSVRLSAVASQNTA